ncbi:hypothetical protein LCGC14_2575250 [marine sediment metagenome]|uniref:Uncharacterized protein n=1 Tax=marine sediment metagenome TaxID=412755 RepID=A0A0F9CS85_9ZZZZ
MDTRGLGARTPRQSRAIAIYCMRLGIAEPLEELVKTSGEAGRLIRELEGKCHVSKKSNNNKS